MLKSFYQDNSTESCRRTIRRLQGHRQGPVNEGLDAWAATNGQGLELDSRYFDSINHPL